jgi:ACT domain-containing protein
MESSRIKVNVDLSMKDVPGQLVAGLEPISKVDGNIVGVVHHRDAKVGGRITVNVTFEVLSRPHLDRVLEFWKERDMHVLRMGSVFETYPIEYLLVGEISPSRLEDMIEEVKGMTKMESVDIRYSSILDSKKRAAMVTAKVRRKEDVRKIEEFFDSKVQDNGLLVIRGLGE